MGLDSADQPHEFSIRRPNSRSPRPVRDSAERYGIARQRPMDIRPMPPWVLFGGRITPREKVNDTKRFAIGDDEAPANLTMKSATVARIVRNLPVTTISGGSAHRLRPSRLGCVQLPVQLPYNPVLLPCSCVAATPYNPRAGCTGCTPARLRVRRSPAAD
jgi:hypothetical protein